MSALKTEMLMLAPRAANPRFPLECFCLCPCWKIS